MPGNVFLRFNNLPYWKQIVYLRQQSLGLIFENLFAGEAVERSGDGSFDFAKLQRNCIGGNACDLYAVGSLYCLPAVFYGLFFII